MTSAWALYLRSVLSSSGRTRTGSPVADRKSTRLNSSHLVISYAVLFFKKKTRLNSSHLVISYAVFCLKKKTLHASHATEVESARQRLLIFGLSRLHVEALINTRQIVSD